jgi:membrane protein required for colicin V production
MLVMGYDALMLAIVAWTSLRGAARGMAWQLAAIAALVLCFLFATPLSLVVAPAISLEPPLNRWVAMLGIYLAFSFGCFGAARLFRGWLEAAKFEEYDRHLGALFGFLKGATLCLVISFFAVCLAEKSREYVLQSYSGQLAGRVLDQLALVMPAELDAVLAPSLRRFDEPLESTTPRAADAPAQPGHWMASGESAAEFRGSHQPGETAESEAPATIEALSALSAAVSQLVSNSEQNPSDQNPSERQNEIEALLKGIPMRAAAAALHDWQADLLGSESDPDPETDAGATLDHRLLRQLRAAGTAIEDLPRPVRNRLLESNVE